VLSFFNRKAAKVDFVSGFLVFMRLLNKEEVAQTDFDDEGVTV